jgi:hypothetical protein
MYMARYLIGTHIRPTRDWQIVLSISTLVFKDTFLLIFLMHHGTYST